MMFYGYLVYILYAVVIYGITKPSYLQYQYNVLESYLKVIGSSGAARVFGNGIGSFCRICSEMTLLRSSVLAYCLY